MPPAPLSPQQINTYQSQMTGAKPPITPSQPVQSQGLLSPQQIQQYKAQMGQTTAASSPNNSWDSFDSAMKPTPNPADVSPFQRPEASAIKSAAMGGINQIQKGGEQIATGVQNGDIGSIGQGLLSGAAGSLNTALSPLTAVVQETAKLPGISDTLGAVKKYITDPASNAISNIPALQQFMQKYPNADEVLQNLLTVVGALGGGKTTPEAGVAVKNAATEAGNLDSDVSTLAGKAVKPITEPVGNAVSTLKNKATQMAANTEKTQWAKPSTMPSGFNKAKDIYTTAQNNGHDISNSLIQNGVKLTDNVETSPTGKKVFSTSDTAEKIHADAAKTSNEMLRPALEKANTSVPKTPVQDVISAAEKNIAKTKMTAEAKDKMISNLNETKVSLSKQYPQGMSLTDLHDEKIVRDINAKYSPVGDISTNMEATKNKAIADAARKMVEDKAPEGIPVKEFNSALAKQHQTANYLEALNGKAVPRTMASNLAKWGGKIAGASVGGSLGGGILGSLGGYHLGGIVESVIEGIPTQLRGQLLDNLEKTNPEAFNQVQKYLSDQMPSATPPATMNKGGNAANSNSTPTVSPTSNTNLSMPKTVQSFEPKSKTVQGITKAAKYVDSIPGKQGGYVKLSNGDIVKQIDTATKDEINTAVKYIDSGSITREGERNLNTLLDKYKISPDLSVAKIKSKLNALLDKTKTK